MNEIEKEFMRFLYYSGGKTTYDKAMELLGIDEKTFRKIMKKLEKRGLLTSKKIEHTFVVPNVNKMNELKLILRILTYICVEKMCLESELLTKYKVERAWLRTMLRKYDKKGVILIKKSVLKGRNDFEIRTTKALWEYLGEKFHLADIDDVIIIEKENVIEQNHLSPLLFESFNGLREAISSELTSEMRINSKQEQLFVDDIRKRALQRGENLSDFNDKELLDIEEEGLENEPIIHSIKNNPELEKRLMELSKPFFKYVDVLTEEGIINSYDDITKLLRESFPELDRLIQSVNAAHEE